MTQTTEIAHFTEDTLGWEGTTVLGAVSVTLHKGERIALLGKSGVGKSTLLTALREHIEARRPDLRTAIVPQDHGLVPQLSAFHNVYMGRLDERSTWSNLRTLVWPTRADRIKIDQVLDAVGLSGLGRKSAETLSGGQRQRIALARALYRGGDVLFADEPVSAVDQKQGPALLDQTKDNFSTAVMALHNVELARAYATRVIGLRDGAIAFDVAAADLDDGRVAELYA